MHDRRTATHAAYDSGVFNAGIDSTAKVYTVSALYSFGANSLKAGDGHRNVDSGRTGCRSRC
jgi:hypothetical protein